MPSAEPIALCEPEAWGKGDPAGDPAGLGKEQHLEDA